MIEGDARLRLPLCYEAILLPFFDRITECQRILNRRYDSSLDFESNDGQEAARRQLDEMEHIARSVELYRGDLELLLEAEYGGKGKFKSSWLIRWAREKHGVDIFGIYNRLEETDLDPALAPPEGTTIPERRRPSAEEVAAWAERNTLSGDRLRRFVFGEPEDSPPEYGDGQHAFLAMAWLIDQLLTNKNGDWRQIVSDETDETSVGYLINGRIHRSAMARKVAAELPRHPDGKDPVKAITIHVGHVLEFFAHGQDHIFDFSAKALPGAYRTIFGLARATWNGMGAHSDTTLETGQYAADTIAELTAALPPNQLITREALAHCLQMAQSTVAD